MSDSSSLAVSTAPTPVASPAPGSTDPSGTAAKQSAFQLALQNAMNQTPPLTDGGGTDDDPDDGTSLSIRMGSGFPIP